MPSEAAMRAANYLFDTGRIREEKGFTSDEVAFVIDSNTGLPELLKACEGAVGWLDDDDWTERAIKRQLQAALAKAKGDHHA